MDKIKWIAFIIIVLGLFLNATETEEVVVIEQKRQPVFEIFEPEPEYELEVVDEYVLAMEGFIA